MPRRREAVMWLLRQFSSGRPSIRAAKSSYSRPSEPMQGAEGSKRASSFMFRRIRLKFVLEIEVDQLKSYVDLICDRVPDLHDRGLWHGDRLRAHCVTVTWSGAVIVGSLRTTVTLTGTLIVSAAITNGSEAAGLAPATPFASTRATSTW